MTPDNRTDLINLVALGLLAVAMVCLGAREHALQPAPHSAHRPGGSTTPAKPDPASKPAAQAPKGRPDGGTP
jgi:hypothetical protein